MREGVIYVATGEAYRALAVASAASLRGHESERAIDLFTDAPGAAGLGVFDRVHPVPRVHARAKLDCLALSRFERTLFLDCDTRILAPLGDLFDILERFDLALAHDMRRASGLIRAGQVPTPYAFPQMNSGVLLYRLTAPVRALFGEWARRFHETAARRDQPILKDLLWESDIRFYVLPPEFNLRRATMLDAWEPRDARPTILHSHRLLQHLRVAGAPQLSDPAGILAAERAALAGEWARAGPAGERDDPVSRHLAAADAPEAGPDSGEAVAPLPRRR